jgi:hypothetical protein
VCAGSTGGVFDYWVAFRVWLSTVVVAAFCLLHQMTRGACEYSVYEPAQFPHPAPSFCRFTEKAVDGLAAAAASLDHLGRRQAGQQGPHRLHHGHAEVQRPAEAQVGGRRGHPGEPNEEHDELARCVRVCSRCCVVRCWSVLRWLGKVFLRWVRRPLSVLIALFLL